MKLIKVVDEKHYVEGGPKCKVTMVELNYSDDNEGHSPNCPVCHATGIQAVELWPDKVKAEWLKANNPVEGILTISPSGVGWSVSFIGYDVNEYPIPSPSGDDAWGEAEDFSATLTAAVINVAKEEK